MDYVTSTTALPSSAPESRGRFGVPNGAAAPQSGQAHTVAA